MAASDVQPKRKRKKGKSKGSRDSTRESRQSPRSTNRNKSMPRMTTHMTVSQMIVRNPLMAAGFIEVAVKDGQDDMCGRALGACFAAENSLLLPIYSVICDVADADSLELVMRGGDIYPTVISEFFIVFGNEFIQKTIGKHLVEIASSKLSFETDFNRLKREMAIDGIESEEEVLKRQEENAGNLSASARTVADTLFDGVDLLPDEMVIILAYIKKNIEEKFPEEDALKCLRIFFMLRFVNVFIAMPDRHGVIDTTAISTLSRRNLALLAKTLQGMASGSISKFDDGRGQMDELIQTLDDLRDDMEEFINSALERGNKDCHTRSQPPLYQKYLDMRVADLTQFCRLYRQELSIFVDRVVENNEMARNDKVLKAIEESARIRNHEAPPLLLVERAKHYRAWDKHQQLIEGGRERKDATASVKSKKNYVMVKAIRREDKTSRVFSIPVDQFSYKRVKREIRTEMGKFQSLKYLDHRASQKINLTSSSFPEFLTTGKEYKKKTTLYVVYVYRKDSEALKKFKEKI